MKMLICSIVTLTCAVLTAETRYAHTGGMLTNPKSGSGSVAVLNAQERVKLQDAFEAAFRNMRSQFPINLRIEDVKPGEASVLKAQSKANYAVIVVDDAKLPSTAIYPDDGYAVVNVAKYTAALKLPDDRAIYEKRCAKGTLKALWTLCRGGGKYPENVATTHNPQELDAAHDLLPIDILESMRKYLEKSGVVPVRKATYRKACQEGWAPAPTNDVQKAIWDKVHQMPSEPLKIKPETKKVRD